MDFRDITVFQNTRRDPLSMWAYEFLKYPPGRKVAKDPVEKREISGLTEISGQGPDTFTSRCFGNSLL
jgi:hypothetical protein